MVLPLKKKVPARLDSTIWTYSAAMPMPFPDAELKQAMKAIAAVAGLNLSEERIARDLAAYKGHLGAIESIRRVELPIEAEPASVVVLEQE
jgi:hypothetical protein